MNPSHARWILIAWGLVGCAERSPPRFTPPPGVDIAVSLDADLDAPSDAGTDVRFDLATDRAALDAPPDPPPDAPPDPPPDAPPDACRAGLTLCGGDCVNLLNSRSHCGTCGRACPPSAPHVVSASCQLRFCVLTCEAGHGNCDGDLDNGCEVDLRTNADHCGFCPHACAPGGACSEGRCCGAGETWCAVASSCIATGTDALHCGACDNRCSPSSLEHGRATCVGGACGLGCENGYHRCGGACVPNTAAACGPSCAACPVPPHATAATCDGSACGVACEEGYVPGGGGCVAAPRPVAPPSTAIVTSQRPTLRWSLGAGTDGAHVDLCRDRALTVGCVTLDATGTRATPAVALAAGVWFWRPRARAAGATGAAAGPTWQFTVGTRSAAVETSSGSTLDANGDGHADVIVGSASATAPGGTRGAFYVHPGSAAGASATAGAPLEGLPRAVIGCVGGANYGRCLGALSTAADVDGDGYVDMVTISRGESPSEPQGFYVYPGGRGGLAPLPATVGIVESSEVLWTHRAGDVNGDGYGDVLFDTRPSAEGGYHTLLYLGGPAGLATSPATTIATPAMGDFPRVRSVDAGDLNGDGYADVAVRATRGQIHVHLGGAGGLPSLPSATLFLPEGAYVDASLAGAGDINGDGYSDLVVGTTAEPSAHRNRLYLYLGGAAGVATSAAATVELPDATPLVAGQLIRADDLNGDGYADVVAVLLEPGGFSVRASVYLGGPGGLTFGGTTGTVGFNERSIAGAGDVNGDGYADLVVSQPGGDGVLLTDVYLGGERFSIEPPTTLRRYIH